MGVPPACPPPAPHVCSRMRQAAPAVTEACALNISRARVRGSRPALRKSWAPPGPARCAGAAGWRCRSRARCTSCTATASRTWACRPRACCSRPTAPRAWATWARRACWGPTRARPTRRAPAAALACEDAAVFLPGHFPVVTAQQDAALARQVLGWACEALARLRVQRAPALRTLASQAALVLHEALGDRPCLHMHYHARIDSECDTWAGRAAGREGRAVDGAGGAASVCMTCKSVKSM